MIVPVVWSELILNLPMFSAHKNNWSAAKINWLVSMWWEDETRISFRVYFRIYFVVCFKYERRVLSWPICFSRSNSICKYLCKPTNKYFDKYKTAKIWMNAWISTTLPILAMNKRDALCATGYHLYNLKIVKNTLFSFAQMMPNRPKYHKC